MAIWLVLFIIGFSWTYKEKSSGSNLSKKQKIYNTKKQIHY